MMNLSIFIIFFRLILSWGLSLDDYYIKLQRILSKKYKDPPDLPLCITTIKELAETKKLTIVIPFNN